MLHTYAMVAPPRGERGLKHYCRRPRNQAMNRRSPSWGAWIETGIQPTTSLRVYVAPPRGERGLKRHGRGARRTAYSRSPSWGAWIETGALT